MFGKTVCEVPGEEFEHALDEAKQRQGHHATTWTWTPTTCAGWSTRTRRSSSKHTGREFPQQPREQLDLAIRAVFESWNAERAVLYRRQERIPADLGTAVNVVAMVFGNLGPDSGTGVAFTRDPASGAQGIYGDYLANAQGEDVVAGIRNTVPLQELEQLDKKSYDELLGIMARLEEHYKDLCDIEFTIERGKLWMLQTRVGKRTAAAAFVIAGQLVDEGLIDLDEALHRVNGAQLAQLMFPRFQLDHEFEPVAKGIGASPGRGVRQGGLHLRPGRRAGRRGRVGDPGPPGDQPGRPERHDRRPGHPHLARRQDQPRRGGGPRAWARPASPAPTRSRSTSRRRRFTVAGQTVNEGDVVSIDGTTGKVYLGEVPVMPSEVVQYFEGSLDPEHIDNALVRAVHRIMTHADGKRRLAVRTNADTGADAARARRFGAEGIGLCRTEHMFLGDRRELVERLILARTDERAGGGAGRAAAVAAGRLRGDLPRDGRPAGHRPADRPAAARVPAPAGAARGQRRGRPGARRGRGQGGGAARRRPADARGEPDARACAAYGSAWSSPACSPCRSGRSPRRRSRSPATAASAKPEIMVPLVGAVQELETVRAEAEKIIAEVVGDSGVEVLIGTMIEVPRAALTAGQIAEAASSSPSAPTT